ncbi:MAG TPA: adenylate/guanylate cyclase domain-containing protein [Patescibacteria group bacterium]|nr:adenylate/guanylate cyclase domain-containing protein [Patescibacteria group bacterium]
MKLSLKGWPVLAVVTILSAAIAFGSVHYVSFLTLGERTVADIRTATLLPPEPQDPDVVIVAITEDTLTRFPYRSPVDRAFLASLLRQLESRKPRAIAMDVLLDQATEPDKDDQLKDAIAGLTVPLAVSYTDNPDIVDEDQLAYLNAFLPPRVRVRAELNTDPVDGVVRWIYPGKLNSDGSYSLGFARGVAARVGAETPAQSVEMAWHGSPDRKTSAFRMFPAHLVPILPAAWFTGKIVLIGEVVSLTDRHRTPFASVYSGPEGELPGIEIHAHAVSQMLSGRLSRKLSWPSEAAFALALAALGMGFGRLNLSLLRQLSLAGTTLAMLWAASFALFHYVGLMVPLVEPSLAFALAIWGTDAFTGRESRRQKEFINSAFSRYLNPQLVSQLSNDPSRLTLGGESRDMTLLFCDVRGFTTISELFDAQGLTRLMNRFLTPMTDVILQNKGTIDKYMGDCIMAFWNAPLDDPDHAANACRSALVMMERLAPLNAELEADAKIENRRHVPIKIGIGLNSGTAVVGNMGSTQRFDYSVLGDNVNLASRLEGQSKGYGVSVVIGENTRTRAPDFACLELDLIQVKGKTEAVRIFALLGDATMAASAPFQALAAEHAVMLAAYRGQNWAAAESAIARCLTLGAEFSFQRFYEIYQERINSFRIAPPPMPWDGVYVALSK